MRTKTYNENKLQEIRKSTSGRVDKRDVFVHDAILTTRQRSQRRKRNNEQRDERKFRTNTSTFDAGNMTTTTQNETAKTTQYTLK